MRSKLSLIVTALIFLIIGFLTGAVYVNWCNVSHTFFNITITDLAQIGLTLIIAIFITYLINRRASKEFKRSEIVLDIIERTIDRINKIFENGIMYMRNNKINTEPDLLGDHKKLGSLISLLNDLNKKYKISGIKKDLELLKKEYFSFKRLLTDSPFGENKRKYDKSIIGKYEDQYLSLIRLLYIMKMNIYR